MADQIPYTGTFKTLREITERLNNTTTPMDIPAPPAEDGTYTLTCAVTDGEAVYSWVLTE